jgi:enoyl-CoA hydratase
MNELVVERSGNIVSIILDRPPLNALTLPLYRHILDAFRDVALGTARCVVLTARGDAFCTGVDLNELINVSPEEDPKRSAMVRETFRTVRTCPIPVVAALNGPALGAGAVLASVADIRIGSDAASIGLNQIDIGRCGGGAHLGRFVSPGTLRRMSFSGQPLSASEAYRVGLIDELVPSPELLLPAAYHLAGTIAGKSPIGMRMAKETLNQLEFLPLEEGFELEQQYSTQLMHTEDAREAARATFERRPPQFKGR